jgi:hypothetical protein
MGYPIQRLERESRWSANLYSLSFPVFQKLFIRQLTITQHFWDIKTLFEGLAYEGERKE